MLRFQPTSTSRHIPVGLATQCGTASLQTSQGETSHICPILCPDIEGKDSTEKEFQKSSQPPPVLSSYDHQSHCKFEAERGLTKQKKAFNYSVAVWRVQYLYKATSTKYVHSLPFQFTAHISKQQSVRIHNARVRFTQIYVVKAQFVSSYSTQISKKERETEQDTKLMRE